MSARVYVAVYLVDVEMPWVRSLKEKRALILPVTEKLKVRFPVSVARLDGLNAHDWERIGVTAISADAQWLDALMLKVAGFIEGNAGFRIRASDCSVDIWDAPALSGVD